MEILTIPGTNRVVELLAHAGSDIMGFVDTLKSGVVKVAKGIKDKIVNKVKSFDWKNVKTKVKESVKGVKKFVKNVSILGYEKLKTYLYDAGISLSERQLDDLEKIQEINSINEDKISEMPKDDVGKLIENISGLKNMDELMEVIMNALAARGITPNGEMPELNGEQNIVVQDQVLPIKPNVVQDKVVPTPQNVAQGKFITQQQVPQQIKPDSLPKASFRELQAFMEGFNAAIKYAMGSQSFEEIHSMGVDVPERSDSKELEESPKLEPVEPETSIPEVPEAPSISQESPELYQPLGPAIQGPVKVSLLSMAASAIKSVPAKLKEKFLDSLERGFTTVNIKSTSSKERIAEVTGKLTMEERIEIQRSKNSEKLETYRQMRSQIRQTQEEMKRKAEMEQMQMDEEGPVLSRGFITPGSLWIFMGILGSILEFGALFIFLLFN